MFGIRFEGHVDMRRILLYDEFVGHPLRKDYPVQKSQPRMDLRSPERDAVEEFRHFYQDRNRPA
jgi:NADH-quinone oxidoreductase subunit C